MFRPTLLRKVRHNDHAQRRRVRRRKFSLELLENRRLLAVGSLMNQESSTDGDGLMVANPPTPVAAIDFQSHVIGSYGRRQDVDAIAQVEDGGATLRLSGNTWKQINYPYEVTPNTLLEFEFRSSVEGEVHGIGLDRDVNLTQSFVLQLYGTEDWGVGVDDYESSAPDWQHYTIPIGQHYTGSFEYLFFINDHDVPEADAEGLYSNVRLYESPSAGIPVAQDDAFGLQEDSGVHELDVLANDLTDEGETLTITSVSNGSQGGTVEIVDGKLIEYQPPQDFFGEEVFTYTINDGIPGNDSTATVMISVAAVNDAPVAADDSYSAVQGMPLSISAPGVLANDQDLEGDPLAVADFTQPSYGTLTIAVDGSFSYQPDPGFVGTDSFRYAASDASDFSNSATVTITVAAMQSDPQLAHGVLSVSDQWQTVTLEHSYESMVVVATPNYDSRSASRVVRIRNASGNSFQIAATGAGIGVDDSSINVHYIVLEEGVYDADGYKLEAVKYNSTVTDSASSWIGESRSFQQSYAEPVVLGQVMTYNDSDWSVFWAASDGNLEVAPNGDSLTVGKHVGEDFDSTRADETIGYVVIEASTSGADEIEGLRYVAAVGPDSIGGIGDSPGYSYTYNALANATTAVASQVSMQGTNGGWAVLYGQDPITSSGNTIELAIDEDQLLDSERQHIGEQVAYLIIESTAENPTNVPPVANAQTVSTFEDTPLSINLTGSDLDGDPLTYSVVDDPAHGSLSGEAPNLTYTPAADFFGNDSFTFKVNDGKVDSTVVTVGIEITAVNDRAVVNLDSNDSSGVSPNYRTTFDISNPVAVAIVDTDLTITDIDSSMIASATVTLNQRPDGIHETLSATAAGTISTSDIRFDVTSGVLTIQPAGGATLPEFEQVLRSLTYNNTAGSPTVDIDRIASIVINDGTENSDARFATVSLPPRAYTAPTIDLDGSAAGTGFETTLRPGDPGIAVVDADLAITASRPLTQAVVSLTSSLGTADRLSVDVSALPDGIRLDATSSSTKLVLVSNGATTAEFEQALQQVSFSTDTTDARVSEGLVVLYDLDEAAGSIVHDVSGVGSALDLTIADLGSVSWVPGGLSLDSATIIASSTSATKIYDAVTESGALTIETWIQPDLIDQGGTPPARIVTMSADSVQRNFTLGQDLGNYDFRLRSTATNVNGTPSTRSVDTVQTSSLAHVVYTRDPSGVTQIYVDGKLEVSGRADGDLSNWGSNYLFALGNELTMDRPWLGDLHLVSVYDRALSSSEVLQNFDAGADPTTSDRIVHIELQDSTFGLSNTAVTTIEIGEANIPPTAAAHSYQTVRDVPLTVNPRGLLAGATDPDGDPLSISSYEATTRQGGTISNVDPSSGSFVYVPRSGFIGIDTFTYTITDGRGGFDTETVSLTIAAGEPVLNLDANNSGGRAPNFAAVFDLNLPVAVTIADSDLDIDDVNDVNLDSATVTITQRPDGSDEVLAATPSGSIGAEEISFDAATGVLTISPLGGAPLEDFEQVLRSVTYSNTAAAPTIGIDRTVAFVVSDGEFDSDVRTSTVAVVGSLPTAASFPGAVGFGATATGGRGGDVYRVTNLLDYGAGETAIVGSFRHAIESQSGPRTIVFATGGNLELERTLNIGSDDLTIAGQTAPGDGITIWGYGVKMIGANNVIVRGLRFRVGDFNAAAANSKPSKGRGDLSGDQADPLEIGWSDRVIIDHVSSTWGIDETLTVWESTNITVQNSILAESLNDSYHPKGPHGFGAILRGAATPTDRANGVGGITYYGNLFTKHDRRSPAYNSGQGGTDIEFVNNVVYNWGNEPGHSETNVGGSVDARINYIGNYVIAGADSKASLINLAFHEFSTTGTQFYHRDTVVDSDLDRNHDGVAVGDSAFSLFEDPFLTTPLNFPTEVNGDAVTAQQAYDRAVATAGAYLHRDYHDQRLIDEMVGRTGQIIDSQDDLISLYGISNPITPLDPGTPANDRDGDGMPDTWETTNGLDPLDATDRNGTNLSRSEYTNLEVYLNSLFSNSLHAPAAANAQAGGGALKTDALEELYDSTLEIWAASGLSDDQLAQLADVELEVADLRPGLLAETSWGLIRVDDNAADWGWFVDPTPGENEEFELLDGEFFALEKSAADGRMDLLTALLHEQGHLLGYGHSDDSNDLMAEELAVGMRHLPSSEPIEAVSDPDPLSAYFAELGAAD